MSLHVVVAGSSGFLGRHLVHRLRSEGHTVERLVRGRAQGPDEVPWDPYSGHLDPEVLRGADVVVNLAGSPTAGNPHSSSWARELRESRVTTTRVLAQAVAACERPPVFLAGNGISYYGDHGATPVTDFTDSRGDALLTSVTRDWEAATTAAREAGARVVVLRTSPVLDREAPPLKQMLLPFRLGLGARLGDGRQYFPCISLRDWVGAVTFAATSDDLTGPVILSCPHPPTNAELTAALADAVHRKARLAVPSLLIRTGAGPMAPELLGSVNAQPEALQRAGYRFQDLDVRDVLSAALSS